jgi:hypothetical protein
MHIRELWFLPVLNERFITNDEGMPALLLGFDTLYDQARGILKISHTSAITKFATKHNVMKISSSTSPCTPELHKQIKNFKYNNSPEEATEIEAIGGAYRMYLGAWSNGTLGANNDATTESHDKTRIKIYVTSDEVALQTSNNNVPVLHVHGERGHCSNIHIK